MCYQGIKVTDNFTQLEYYKLSDQLAGQDMFTGTRLGTTAMGTTNYFLAGLVHKTEVKIS